MYREIVESGDYIQTMTFPPKKKGEDFIPIGGIVIKCFQHFVLVQLEYCKRCFFYNEIEKISQSQYNKMLKNKPKRFIKGGCDG